MKQLLIFDERLKKKVRWKGLVIAMQTHQSRLSSATRSSKVYTKPSENIQEQFAMKRLF